MARFSASTRTPPIPTVGATLLTRVTICPLIQAAQYFETVSRGAYWRVALNRLRSLL